MDSSSRSTNLWGKDFDHISDAEHTQAKIDMGRQWIHQHACNAQRDEAAAEWQKVRIRLSAKLAQVSKATNQRYCQLIYNTLAGPKTAACPEVFYCSDEFLLACLNAYGQQLDNPLEVL